MRKLLLLLLCIFCFVSTTMLVAMDGTEPEQQTQQTWDEPEQHAYDEEPLYEESPLGDEEEDGPDNTAIWVALITTLGGVATAFILNRKKEIK